MIAAALALLLVTAAAVEDDPRFREARQMFETFQLDGALARFNLILLDDELPAGERARVLLWKGLTEAELGRFAEASRAFEKAFVLDEDAALPIDASPKVIEMLDEARQRAAERAPPAVDTRDDGTVHPSGPGVLIKTTPLGRMDASVQERPPPPVAPQPETPFPWLLVAGGTTAGLGAVTLGAGGVAGTLALLDHTRAVDARGAKETTLASQQAQAEALVANVLYGVGGAVVVGGAAVALTGLLLPDEAPRGAE